MQCDPKELKKGLASLPHLPNDQVDPGLERARCLAAFSSAEDKTDREWSNLSKTVALNLLPVAPMAGVQMASKMRAGQVLMGAKAANFLVKNSGRTRSIASTTETVGGAAANAVFTWDDVSNSVSSCGNKTVSSQVANDLSTESLSCPLSAYIYKK